MNKIAVVTICLTIAIIWKRKLSPGNTAGVLNANKDEDSESARLPPPHLLPWLQKSMLPEQPDVDTLPNVLVEALDVRVSEILSKDNFDQKELNNFDRRGDFLSNSGKKNPVDGLNEDSEIQHKTEYEIEDPVRDRNSAAGKKAFAVIPHFDHYANLSASKSEPLVTVKIRDKPPKIIAQIDDNDESNFAKFRFQKNFQRRDEESSRNLSGTVDLSENKVEPQSDLEIANNSGPENLQTPSENVLLKENRAFIKDDRNEFFGRMPMFNDYDLPILRNSGQTNDTETAGETKVAVSKQSSTTPTDISLEPDDDDDDDADDRTIDETMEGVVIIGSVNASRKYAVFSTTTEERNSLSYIFYLPLTAFAWKRIGFDSIVIIVGAKDQWQSDPLFSLVLSAVIRLDGVVIFLEPRSEKSIMISQVARIFAANILRSAFPGIDSVYIITSDADLWPIYGDIYNLPPGKRILSLNSDCCAPFKHRGTVYKMLPMANVGMTVKNWRRVTRKFEESPKTIDDILTIFVQEFGTVALRPVHKGDNVGWYLDQMMISILIAKWINERGAKTVKFIPRDVGVDRIDRAGWGYSQNDIADKVDAHLLLEAHIPGVWVRITPLLRLMYGDMSQRYLWCVDYYEEFQKLFLVKYRSKQS